MQTRPLKSNSNQVEFRSFIRKLTDHISQNNVSNRICKVKMYEKENKERCSGEYKRLRQLSPMRNTRQSKKKYDSRLFKTVEMNGVDERKILSFLILNEKQSTVIVCFGLAIVINSAVSVGIQDLLKYLVLQTFAAQQYQSYIKDKFIVYVVWNCLWMRNFNGSGSICSGRFSSFCFDVLSS